MHQTRKSACEIALRDTLIIERKLYDRLWGCALCTLTLYARSANNMQSREPHNRVDRAVRGLKTAGKDPLGKNMGVRAATGQTGKEPPRLLSPTDAAEPVKH
jgi:hypothetical protein